MASLSISDFSRASQLRIKALRHYHRIGLLEPTEVDELTGYRRYSAGQIADGLVIKRLRDLDVPLDEIREMLQTSDAERRAVVLREHLDRLIGELGRLRTATAQLDDLLAPRTQWPQITHRTVAAQSGIAIQDTLHTVSALAWLHGAMAELKAALRHAGARAIAPAVGVFDDAIFTDGEGPATIIVPCDGPVAHVGRITEASVPGAELCVAVHHGPPPGIDRAYAALGEHVARHEITIPGALREYYLVGPLETDDEQQWVTEVGWPVFRTRGDG